MIWVLVKRQVATKNTTFKIADVEKLMHEAIDSVTKVKRINCVHHTEKIQEKDYQEEMHREVILEPIILIILPGESSTDEDDDDEDDF